MDRKVYTSLDMLGDIGGLAGSLHAFANLAIGLLMYQSVNNFLSDNLYKYKPFKTKQDNGQVHRPKVQPKDLESKDGSRRFSFGVMESVKISLQDLLCDKKCFNKRDKLAHKALHGIKQELDVAEMIKLARINNHFLQKMHSKEEWKALNDQFSLKQVELLSASGESETQGGGGVLDHTQQIPNGSLDSSAIKGIGVNSGVMMRTLSPPSDNNLDVHDIDDDVHGSIADGRRSSLTRNSIDIDQNKNML